MIDAKELSRSFSYNGVRLPDPDPRLTPEEVKSMCSHQYPELATAAITGPELIAWWGRAQPRLMFFGDGNTETKKLNGKMYPHPALVFMIHGRELFVRALAEDHRPTAATRLKSAPYWKFQRRKN